MADDVKSVTADLKRKRKKSGIKKADLLSSGSTLVNLACTGTTLGAFPKGRIINVVGDSESGKSWLSMTTLAEAANDERFQDYRLCYFDVEHGVTMDVTSFFGKKLAERIEWFYPTTVQENYDLIGDLLEDGRPFISITDSMDALTSDQEVDQVQKEKTARRKGKDTSGSYGTDKPRVNSARLRVVANQIKETGSIVLILSQTRTNIGFTARFDPKTISGGLALKFYSTLQLWLSVGKFLKTKVNGRSYQLGAETFVKVKKNRVNGKKRTVKFTFYHSHGIDDVGSNIDFLLETKYWRRKAGKIDATEFGVALSKEALVMKVENENLEEKLKVCVRAAWNEIEDACTVRRKNRYE